MFLRTLASHWQVHRLVHVIAMGLLVATPVQSSYAEALFKPEPTQTCVSEQTAASPSLSGYSVLDCVGQAAQACMNTPGGDTTIGMIECLQGELSYWDRRLNAAYAKRISAAKQEDAEMNKIRSSASTLEDSLRKMQRAWISYRDASCLYEQAQWQGGTGGGPATAACHMHETARQALRLEGWWSQ